MPVLACSYIFHFKIARRQQLCGTAANWNRVQVKPSGTLPRKHDAIASCPNQLILGDSFMEDAACARVSVPNLLPVARCGFRDSNGPRLALAPRTKWKMAFCHRNAHEGNSPAVR